MKPILRYFGGKSRIAKDIVALMPAHNIYCEPFGGGASVLLNKAPSRDVDIYNDLNKDVVNLFRILRDEESTNALVEKILLTPFSRDEFAFSYEKTDDKIESARRLIVRSFQGFSSDATNFSVSGFRADCSSSAITTWQTVHQRLIATSRRLRNVLIECKPAIELIKSLSDRSDALFYLDPPYVLSSRTTHGNKKGYENEMFDSDHGELLNVALNSKAKILISGYDNKLYNKKLKNWTRIEFENSDVLHQKTKEIIWMNFENKQKSLMF